MRLPRERRERKARSSTVLGEKEGSTNLLEKLDFVQPGDVKILESIAQNALAEKRDIQAALALAGLLFPDAQLSDSFIQAREQYIQAMVSLFNSYISNPNVFHNEESFRYLRNAAEQLFPFRSRLLPEAIRIPDQAIWDGILQEVKTKSQNEYADPTDWLKYLLFIDPDRFRKLPKEDLFAVCSDRIAKERAEYPVSKDRRQMRTLGALTSTRMMFPDRINPTHLSDEEREVTRVRLASERKYAKAEEGSGFAYYLYLLSLMEAPELRADERGLYLGSGPDLGQKRVELPERLHVS